MPVCDNYNLLLTTGEPSCTAEATQFYLIFGKTDLYLKACCDHCSKLLGPSKQSISREEYEVARIMLS